MANLAWCPGSTPAISGSCSCVPSLEAPGERPPTTRRRPRAEIRLADRLSSGFILGYPCRICCCSEAPSFRGDVGEFREDGVVRDEMQGQDSMLAQPLLRITVPGAPCAGARPAMDDHSAGWKVVEDPVVLGRAGSSGGRRAVNGGAAGSLEF